MPVATDLSRIDEIVDASAAIAAAWVEGVKAVWGIGSGKIIVPVGGTWDGQSFAPPGGVWAEKEVRAFGGNVPEPMTHVSDMPDAPKIVDYSAGVTEIKWRIPMRLYVQRADNAYARRLCAPYYARYLLAFAKHSYLLGTCNSAEITSFDLFHDKDGSGYVGIAMILEAWERLDQEFEPGETPYR